MGVGDSALRRPRSNQPKGGRREEEQGREQLHVELSPSCSRRREHRRESCSRRKENGLRNIFMRMDPVVWVNPAQPPSVSRCAPRSRSPVSLIVLTRSCSRRWGPCPSPTPCLVCPFYLFMSAGQILFLVSVSARPPTDGWSKQQAQCMPGQYMH